MIRRRSQRGLVLVTALLVVAIVAAVTAYLSVGQQVWLRQVQNLADRGQMNSMRQAALDFIGILLMREAKDGPTDHLGEQWATGYPPLPFEGGTIAATVTDATARFNLNNLLQAVAPGKPGAPGTGAPDPNIAVFQKLLRLLELDEGLADAVVDWVDADSNPRPGGAEDVEYLASVRPYRAANQPLASVDELRLIKGFTPEIVEKLRPYVTVLPEVRAINVNTAPAIVIAALVPNLTLAQAQAIVQQRDKTPFKDANEFGKLLPPNQSGTPNAAVATAYFLVELHIGYGRLRRSTVALIHRVGGDNASRVLWHHPLYPKLPSDDKASETKT